MAPADNEVTATWPNFYSRNISFAGPEVTCSTAGEGADALTGIGPSHPELKVLSLFAGIGGFDLGLERTGGFKTVAVAELDDYASSILRLRFPDAPNVGDVTVAEYPDADVICAGFPCQDISFAGAGAGLAGARSGLFWEVVRAISVVRPEYVILENVAALLSRGLDVVLGALASVGYDTEWHCIPASAVGAPHRRDRIWIIAHPRGEQHEGSRAPLSGKIAALLASATSDTESDGQSLSGAGDKGRDADEACGIGLWVEPGRDGTSDGAGSMADSECERRSEMVEPVLGRAETEGAADQALHGGDAGGRCWWAVEPNVGRVAHGVPSRVDRLRCLGNAVVPQIPELIGHAILQSIAGEVDSPTGEAGVATDFPGQPIDHSTGNAAEGLGALLSVPFHDQLNSAEAHENNGA